MNSAIICALVLTAIVASTTAKEYVRACYYSNWSQHLKGNGQFLPENIEPGLCSHIFYAFVGMDKEYKLRTVEANDEEMIKKVNDIKKKQADLKTLLSFGGYTFNLENGTLIREMIVKPESRKIFIDSAIAFVRDHKFDGFDLNWYPDAEHKENFVKLVKEFREAIDKEVNSTSNATSSMKKERLLLTLAVPPMIENIRAGYDGKALAESADFLNIMAFDYHGSWENQTGFNAPLFDRDGDGMSLNSTLNHLVEEQKVPKNKLLVGFATYGRGWKLENSSMPNSIPAPAVGPSPAQQFTMLEGVAAYNEICTLIEKEKYVRQYDEIQEGPIIFKDGVWIGYDDRESWNEGLDWLIQNDYAGAFAWTLAMDDFRGLCTSSKGTYPLIKAMKKKLVPDNIKRTFPSDGLG